MYPSAVVCVPYRPAASCSDVVAGRQWQDELLHNINGSVSTLRRSRRPLCRLIHRMLLLLLLLLLLLSWRLPACDRRG